MRTLSSGIASFLLAMVVMIALAIAFGFALELAQRPVSTAFSTEGVGPNPDR